MNIAGIHTTKPRTQRYIDAFVKGTPGTSKIYQFRELQELPPEDLTMYGILAGSGEIYKRCEQEKRRSILKMYDVNGKGYTPETSLSPPVMGDVCPVCLW